jgi:hypothetical protein
LLEAADERFRPVVAPYPPPGLDDGENAG